MRKTKNFILNSNRGKEIVADLLLPDHQEPREMIIFSHGYKGFKDWGPWELMGEYLVRKGFAFLKFNFSHNGGTLSQPIDFPDLDAFGRNNYTTEVEDLHKVIDTVKTKQVPAINYLNIEKIHILAHSRAGGIGIITASERDDISSVITLAGVSDYASRFPSGTALSDWKNNGVYHVKNGRTGQDMPHYYQFFEDFSANADRLDIRKRVSRLTSAHLIIHGTGDETVKFSEAETLKEHNPDAELYPIKDAGHTFGGKHPWKSDKLPEDLEEALQKIIARLV